MMVKFPRCVPFARKDGVAIRAADGISIELLSYRELSRVASLWQALEARVGDGSLACSWTWTATWIRHFGDVVPLRFAVARHAGMVVGAALLTLGRERWGGPLAMRKLHIGTAGEPHADTTWVEYNRLLVAPEHQRAFAAALVRMALALPCWDAFALDGFAPEDAAALLDAAPAFRARRVASPAVDLRLARAAGGDLVASLRAGTRQRIRRSLRGFGPIETEWAETSEQALAIFDDLILLHQQRWIAAGRPGAFSSARFTAFHRELIPKLIDRGAVVLFRARAASGVIGCLYSFIEQGNVLFYQGGLATFDDNKLKPGLVTHALCMQTCLDRGLAEYNFLAGEDRYKQELATVDRYLIWASLRRRTGRTLLTGSAEWAMNAAKRSRAARAIRERRQTERARSRVRTNERRDGSVSATDR